MQHFFKTKTKRRLWDFRIFKIGTDIHHLIQVAHQYHYLENGAFPTRVFLTNNVSGLSSSISISRIEPTDFM